MRHQGPHVLQPSGTILSHLQKITQAPFPSWGPLRPSYGLLRGALFRFSLRCSWLLNLAPGPAGPILTCWLLHSKVEPVWCLCSWRVPLPQGWWVKQTSSHGSQDSLGQLFLPLSQPAPWKEYLQRGNQQTSQFVLTLCQHTTDDSSMHTALCKGKDPQFLAMLLAFFSSQNIPISPRYSGRL